MAKKVKHFPSDFSKPKPGAVGSKKDKPADQKKRKSKRSFLKKETTKVLPKVEKKVQTGIPTNEVVKVKPKRTFSKEVKTSVPDKDKGRPKKKTKREGDPGTGNAIFSTEHSIPKIAPQRPGPVDTVKMPLNKFIAHCGICSRRDAVELIKKGKVKVNSLVETAPGAKVSEEDYILYEGKRLFTQKKLVYYLLNKPKNFITTTEDPEDRHTVLDLFHDVDTTRLYPVGRLDRNTTGLLLLTNDGDLAQKLSHPKYNIKKVYQVTLDKPLNKKDLELIANGVLLEDGPAPVDEIAYINPKDKKEIGIEIHTGRNRIVRRIFEHLQYKVTALDRVVYAGLTKKNIPRGSWRQLEEKEVIYLKHFT